MTEPSNGATMVPGRRATQVLLVVILGIVAIGFFVGIEQTSVKVADLTRFTHEDGARPADGVEARSYLELLEEPLTRNNQWLGELDRLVAQRPSLLEEVDEPEANKAATLAARSTRRAYAGAPPTIPHPVKELGDAACVACHTQGVTIRGRLAPPMSHEPKTQCTQCHVVSEAPMPGARTGAYLLSVENSFRGTPEPANGEAAWPGAPPTIPHSTHMRSNCMSCHGVNGRQGLRSSHPWRQNCMQCHTPDAALDQQPPSPTLPLQP